MKSSYYRITLDVKEVQSQVSLTVKQGDTSRGIYISLVDGSLPYEIDGSQCSAVFHGVKSDGTKVQDFCVIENNRIRYDFSEQTTVSPGLVECEVSLHNIEDGVIVAARFTIIVDNRLIVPSVLSEDEVINFNKVLTLVGEFRNNEDARASAEQDRTGAELLRQNREDERVTAENEREVTESVRKFAENERKIAENGRNAAEAERQRVFEENEQQRQEFFESNKTTVIDKNSTDDQYPTAKAVYDELQKFNTVIHLEKSDFINGAFADNKGIIQTDYWIITPNSIRVSVDDVVAIKPSDGLRVWWRIYDSSDLSKATTLINGGIITHEIEYVSEFDGYLNIQIAKVDNTVIAPEDYSCEIIVNSSRIGSVEQRVKELEDRKHDTLNKVTIINKNSTDEQYPTAKAVYQFVGNSVFKRLANGLKTYFTNVQTLLPQLAYATEDNIGNTLIQNAQDIVDVLESGATEEPETPTDKTLVSISATYTGGNVAVGKDVSSLTGVTVTAIYSDGSTSDITNYTLSGEIAEGENTITVTYEGLTTTFVVIGEEVATDENKINIYNGFVGQDSTSTSEPTTNDLYPNAVCSDVMYIPFVEGSTASYVYDIKLNSNITDTSKINWKTYDSTGVRKGSNNGDTVSGVRYDYGVRLNILDQTATADGSDAVITGFTITVKIGSTVKGVFEYGVNDLRG